LHLRNILLTCTSLDIYTSSCVTRACFWKFNYFKMFKSLPGAVYVLYFLFNQSFTLLALKPDLDELVKHSKTESAQWPLQAGYPGLTIKNLDEYVSLFSHCLVNIQNYQGVEIIGIKSPVYITRFDVAKVEIREYFYLKNNQRLLRVVVPR